MSRKFYRKTKRLEVRPLQRKDFNAWILANSTMLPQQNTWDSENRDSSELSLKKFIALLKDQKAKRITEEFCDYGIFNIKTGELIGQIALMNFIRSVTQSSFLGYRIYNRYWGKGYAQEAIMAVVDIAFKDHQLHRVVAGIEPQNKRSLSVVKKLGFRYEGLSKRVVLLRDQWRDLSQYALTTEDLGIPWIGTIQKRKR